jgi:hypothetical protein
MAARIAEIERAGLVPGLDATELGRPVYEKLGFRPLLALSRFAAAAPAWPQADRSVDLAPLVAADLPALTAYDEAATGSVRRFLLEHLAARCPGAAWVARSGGRIAGFALGRDGVRASGIGPVVAPTASPSRRLAAAAGRHPGPTMIDVPDAQAGFVAALAAAGFTRQRGFTRMIRGDDTALDRTARLYAPAGPEFG